MIDTKKHTILVVEDDISSYCLLKELLTEKNYIVLHAEKGKKAIELCKNNKQIDLVLMDIRLPDVNGCYATKEIKKYRMTLPIIAVTAMAMKTDKENCFDAGCDDYVSKPINIVSLITKIQSFLLN